MVNYTNGSHEFGVMESQLLIQSEMTQGHTHNYTEVSSQHHQQTTQVTKKASRKKSVKKNKEENNISVKSGSRKLQSKLTGGVEAAPACAMCARPAYAMERVQAVGRTYHRDCFRCIECGNKLTVETYQSHSGQLYCKQHFKNLFAPRAVEEEEEGQHTQKKHQMIICESNPKELPPDVVRASEKPDLGLEELSTLDVKSRFEMFEQKSKAVEEPRLLEHHVTRDKSSALLSKLAKFKSKGMDIGVADECLNGIPIEPSSSEGEEDEDSVLKKSYRHTSTREQPVSFCNMSEIVGKFESGDLDSAGRREERKQEIQNIRSRLFMGKQAKIKEMYEQSVLQSEQSVTSAEKMARDVDVDVDHSRSIKQKFENGEIYREEDKRDHRNKEYEDETLFNEGIGKKSRSIFQELDANNSGPVSPPVRSQDAPRRKEKAFIPKDVVRSADRTDDVHVQTADISDKFRFFETYRPNQATRKEFRITPPREAPRPESPEQEVYRDPTVVRSDEADTGAEAHIARQRHTAQRMISVFQQMERDLVHKDAPAGPKPLKSFTPPPNGPQEYRPAPPSSSEEEESEVEEEEEEEERRYIASRNDDALKQAQSMARAKNLRNRFEHWNQTEQIQQEEQHYQQQYMLQQQQQHMMQQQQYERQLSQDQDDESQIETAKSLRQKFENLKTNTSHVKTFAAPKVNRFV